MLKSLSPLELIHVPSLDESELKKLTELCQQIEAYYLVPQDIEWAKCGESFYILQARPITTLVQTDRGIPNFVMLKQREILKLIKHSTNNLKEKETEKPNKFDLIPYEEFLKKKRNRRI